MKTKSILLALFSIFLAFQVNAQVIISRRTRIIPTFEKQTKRRPVNLKMKKGQTVDLKFYVFQGKAYTFTVNAATRLNKVGFRILNDQGEVLFDNALAAYTNSVVLYADRTQKIIFKLTTQPTRFLERDNKRYNISIKVAYKQNIST